MSDGISPYPWVRTEALSVDAAPCKDYHCHYRKARKSHERLRSPFFGLNILPVKQE